MKLGFDQIREPLYLMVLMGSKLSGFDSFLAHVVIMLYKNIEHEKALYSKLLGVVAGNIIPEKSSVLRYDL